jgi:DNA-binding IclR family transcriptional regulator
VTLQCAGATPLVGCDSDVVRGVGAAGRAGGSVSWNRPGTLHDGDDEGDALMSGVQSVERAFAVIGALSVGPAGVTDIANRVSLPKSTVARLLSTLETLRMVEQETAGGTYRLGSGFLDISGSLNPNRSLVATARPHLVELVRTAGESAGIAVADGSRVHFLDQADSDHQIQGRSWTGELLPMHSTSSGMVLLAFADDELRSAVMRNPMEKTAAHTITTAQALGRRLAEVRTHGYCWAYEEFADGMNSVAAPVYGSDGKVIAAVHAHGPAFRFPGNRPPKEIAAVVVDCASHIRHSLSASS